LLYLIFTSGILSALLVNDVVCLMLTPLVVAVMVRGNCHCRLIAALAMSANLGSVATLVGNPQNMIIGHLSKFFPPFFGRHGARGFSRFVDSICGPPVGFRAILNRTAIQRPEGRRHQVRPAAFGAHIWRFGAGFAGFLYGLNLSWTAMAGGALLMVLARRDTHPVLSLSTGTCWCSLRLSSWWSRSQRDRFAGTDLSQSEGLFGTSTAARRGIWRGFPRLIQCLSNVPFVLVAGKWIGNFSQPELMWKVMALATTFAGN